jgi:cyanophycinase-like exopeptidase
MSGEKDFDYYVSFGGDELTAIAPKSGVLLIGGAEGEKSGEFAATQWFLNRAKQGKYLVLRTGGIGHQADWIRSNFRDWLYSAAELSIDSQEAANNPKVVDYILAADALFIAGGDQLGYKKFWEGTKTEAAINYLINQKRVPIAGTSAGMAILGDYYYVPQYQGVLSTEILDDPHHLNTRSIYHNDFIKVPYLNQVLTDTHLDRINKKQPETRYGRLLGLLAKIVHNHPQLNVYAIGLEEGAFVAIDQNGIAKVFGNGSTQGQDAYFLRANRGLPEQLEPGWPLIWNNQGKAVKVYRIAGTPEGSGRFDLKDWYSASGGDWEYWYTLGGQSGLRKTRL